MTQQLGARGVAEAAFSPCQRHRAISLHGRDTYDVAQRLYGRAAPGKSDIAFRVGNAFEAALVRPDTNGAPARLLRSVYTRAGLLGDADTAADLSSAGADALRRIAADRAADRPHPKLLLQARVPLEVDGISTHIIPDVLVAHGDIGWRVGDIKVYVDRDGHTNPYDIAHTCRQIAVGVVALRRQLAHWGIDADVPAAADLVFRRPGPERATVHTLPIPAEITAVETILLSAGDFLAAYPTIATAADVDAIPATRGEHCAASCGMAAACGDPDSAYRHLVGSAHQQLETAGIPATRAAALAAGATPTTADEAAAARWLQRGWSGAA
ncbi:MAG TPA: hypothetical protein VHD87_12820 [Acidimicrobiales bacterium]|nr:hypothetical protein [Acidimicrobiales bacterium]